MEKMEKDQNPYLPVGRKPTTCDLIRYVDFQIMDLNSRTRRNILESYVNENKVPDYIAVLISHKLDFNILKYVFKYVSLDTAPISTV